MQENLGHYSMRALCTALRVSRSGYYAWRSRGKSPCALNEAIARQFTQDKARAGAPNIAHALQQAGMRCSVRTRWAGACKGWVEGALRQEVQAHH